MQTSAETSFLWLSVFLTNSADIYWVLTMWQGSCLVLSRHGEQDTVSTLKEFEYVGEDREINVQLH